MTPELLLAWKLFEEDVNLLKERLGVTTPTVITSVPPKVVNVGPMLLAAREETRAGTTRIRLNDEEGFEVYFNPDWILKAGREERRLVAFHEVCHMGEPEDLKVLRGEKRLGLNSWRWMEAKAWDCARKWVKTLKKEESK